jgi:hypothetical protein
VICQQTATKADTDSRPIPTAHQIVPGHRQLPGPQRRTPTRAWSVPTTDGSLHWLDPEDDPFLVVTQYVPIRQDV